MSNRLPELPEAGFFMGIKWVFGGTGFPACALRNTCGAGVPPAIEMDLRAFTENPKPKTAFVIFITCLLPPNRGKKQRI
jgi:hypothetical protein